MRARLCLLGIVGLIAAGSLCSAQTTSASARLSYGVSGDFRLTNGSTEHLQGPDLAFVFPIQSTSGIDIAFEPSIFGAGRFISSSVTADVYRFMLTAKLNLGKSGLYAKGGVGQAHASNVGSKFEAASGSVGEFGIGYTLKSDGIASTFKPAIELNAFTGGNGQLRGFFIGITGTF